jgi:hypothetical protein
VQHIDSSVWEHYTSDARYRQTYDTASLAHQSRSRREAGWGSISCPSSLDLSWWCGRHLGRLAGVCVKLSAATCLPSSQSADGVSRWPAVKQHVSVQCSSVISTRPLRHQQHGRFSPISGWQWRRE